MKVKLESQVQTTPESPILPSTTKLYRKLKATLAYQNIRLEGNAQQKPLDSGLYWACKCVWFIWRRHLSLSDWSFTKLQLSPRRPAFLSTHFPPQSLAQVSPNSHVIVFTDLHLHYFAESCWCCLGNFHLTVCLSGCCPMTLGQLKTMTRRRRKTRHKDRQKSA